MWPSSTGSRSASLGSSAIRPWPAARPEPGLTTARDDSALQAAVDEAPAANPDVVEKIRGGKVRRRAPSSGR